MHVLWKRSPASVRDVLEAVEADTGWAYTTVKTILGRLAEKGVVAVRKRANTSYYEPQVSRQQARQTAVRSLIDKAFDGTFGSLIQHLVIDERLSQRDRERLAEMMRQDDSAKDEER